MHLALDCFGNDLVIFTLSSYLPGEFVLRVFPLISKSLQSRRFSLSLLGPPITTPNTSTWPVTFDLEGGIYGIHSTSRNLQQVILRAHSITALKLEEELSGPMPTSFPCIEKLSVPIYSRIFFSPSFSFDRFPKLIKIEIGEVDHDTGKELLEALWTLPLVSLIIKNYLPRVSPAKDFTVRGPPAFAHTLRSLYTRHLWLLEALAPYCRSLQQYGDSYHDIVQNNATGLTLLTLNISLRGGGGAAAVGLAIELPQCPRLVELVLAGECPFFSDGTYPNLASVSLQMPDLGSAKRFLMQCPALTHASLFSNWNKLAEMIAVLDPNKCKRLTLDATRHSNPSLDEVESLILRRGFQINDEFFLLTSDAAQQWSRIVGRSPATISKFRGLQGYWTVDHLLFHPSFLPSFRELAVVDIISAIQWDQQMLLSVVKSCAVLKELTVCGHAFSGALEMDSKSLCKLTLEFANDFLKFHLNLPNLTHLALKFFTGEGHFLRTLLSGGDPLIQLPSLRILSLYNDRFGGVSPPSPVFVPCESGHRSLTQLLIEGPRQVHVSRITLQNLPCLRAVKLTRMLPTGEILVDVPGNCDIFLHHRTYQRKGFSNRENFNARIYYDEEKRRWIEEGNEEKEKREAKNQEKIQREKEKAKKSSACVIV